MISGPKKRTGVFQSGHAGHGRGGRPGGGTLVPASDPHQRRLQSRLVQLGLAVGRRPQAATGSSVSQPVGQVSSGPRQGSDIARRHLHQ